MAGLFLATLLILGRLQTETISLQGRLYAVSPDGTRFVMRFDDIYKVYANEEVILSFAAQSRVGFQSDEETLTFSPDGRFLLVYEAVDFSVGETRLFDLAAAEQFYAAEGRSGFSPDGTTFYISSPDYTGLLETDTRRVLIDWLRGATHLLDLPQYTPDGERLIISLPSDPAIFIVDSQEGELLWEFSALRATLSPDGRYLMTDHGTLPWQLYDLESLELLLEASSLNWYILEPFNGFSEDSRYFMVKLHLQVMEIPSGDIIFQSEKEGHFTAGYVLLIQSEIVPRHVTIIRVENGTVLLEAPFEGINYYFSPDARYLVLPQLTTERKIDVYEIESGRLLYTLPYAPMIGEDIRFQEDWIAVEAYERNFLLDMATGEVIAQGNGIVFQNGRAYVSTGEAVEIYD